MTTRDEILQSVAKVSSLPTSALKAITVLQDPRAELSEIARVLHHDPALVANVLKYGNSAFFGARRTITTVEEAITRLGIRNILNMVVSASVGSFALRPIDGYDLRPGALWKHCMAVACGTDELMRVLRRSSLHSAFTAGLLVDIGKHVLGTQLEIDGAAICVEAFESGQSFEHAERNVLGIDHAEVGAFLLEQWGLPEILVSAVRWHHEPGKCPAEHRQLVSIVHASDQICTLAGLGTGIDGCNYRPDSEVFEELEINDRVIEATLCRIVERLEALADMMETSSGSS